MLNYDGGSHAAVKFDSVDRVNPVAKRKRADSPEPQIVKTHDDVDAMHFSPLLPSDNAAMASLFTPIGGAADFTAVSVEDVFGGGASTPLGFESSEERRASSEFEDLASFCGPADADDMPFSSSFGEVDADDGGHILSTPTTPSTSPHMSSGAPATPPIVSGRPASTDSLKGSDASVKLGVSTASSGVSTGKPQPLAKQQGSRVSIRFAEGTEVCSVSDLGTNESHTSPSTARPDAVKSLLRRERNRVSAATSRERQKQYVRSLERNLNAAIMSNQVLTKQVASLAAVAAKVSTLEAENEALKQWAQSVVAAAGLATDPAGLRSAGVGAVAPPAAAIAPVVAAPVVVAPRVDGAVPKPVVAPAPEVVTSVLPAATAREHCPLGAKPSSGRQPHARGAVLAAALVMFTLTFMPPLSPQTPPTAGGPPNAQTGAVLHASSSLSAITPRIAGASVGSARRLFSTPVDRQLQVRDPNTQLVVAPDISLSESYQRRPPGRQQQVDPFASHAKGSRSFILVPMDSLDRLQEDVRRDVLRSLAYVLASLSLAPGVGPVPGSPVWTRMPMSDLPGVASPSYVALPAPRYGATYTSTGAERPARLSAVLLLPPSAGESPAPLSDSAIRFEELLNRTQADLSAALKVKAPHRPASPSAHDAEGRSSSSRPSPSKQQAQAPGNFAPIISFGRRDDPTAAMIWQAASGSSSVVLRVSNDDNDIPLAPPGRTAF